MKHGVTQQGMGKRSPLCVQTIAKNLQKDDSLRPRQHILKLYKGVSVFDQQLNHYFIFYEIFLDVPYLVMRILWLKLWYNNDSSY